MFWPFKKREAKLQHLQVVAIKPGDILVVKSDDEMPDEHARRLLDRIEKELGFRPLFLQLSPGTEVSILRGSPSV